MTTERPPKRATLLRVSPLELRLYVAALLAAVYAISWRAIGGHVAEPAIAAAPVGEAPQRFVWLDRVTSTTPAISVPAGWQIASAPAASTAPPLVRAPSHRAPRVRTRSS